MIEFRGYIIEDAKERMLEKTRQYERKLIFLGTLLILPPVIIFGINTEAWWIMQVYIITMVVGLIVPMIPKSKKEQQAIIPNCIYTDGKTIVCVTEKAQIKRFISDVKTVYDCKTYYELTFKFGKFSSQFICQKDLLTQGTIEEFEALFEGKIDDMSDEF